MREYELEVLEQYHIEVKSTRKIRGAFFCETKEGVMLLKEAQALSKRAPLLYLMYQQLEESGYGNIDIPVLTKRGDILSVSQDGTRYVLKKWFFGRECDVKRENDVLEAAKNLAVLHQKMKWRDVCSVEMKDVIKPPVGRMLQEEYLKHNRELRKVRAFMRKRTPKSEFELLFLKHFEQMHTLSEAVLQRLEISKYSELYSQSIEAGAMVHGDYNYHNVILMSQGIATTNFEHFHIDIQAGDLYYFLRKVMEKHRWNEKLGNAILEAYQSIRPLDTREIEYIALCLAYPEKFWKTANSYYHSNKAWLPEKSLEKLQLAILQTEEKMRFLENIFAFNL